MSNTRKTPAKRAEVTAAAIAAAAEANDTELSITVDGQVLTFKPSALRRLKFLDAMARAQRDDPSAAADMLLAMFGRDQYDQMLELDMDFEEVFEQLDGVVGAGNS